MTFFQSIGPTLHPDVCPGLAEHVGGGAAVVAKVLVGHLADEQRVPVALLLHVAPPVGVQQHRVLEGKKADLVKLPKFLTSYTSS